MEALIYIFISRPEKNLISKTDPIFDSYQHITEKILCQVIDYVFV